MQLHLRFINCRIRVFPKKKTQKIAQSTPKPPLDDRRTNQLEQKAILIKFTEIKQAKGKLTVALKQSNNTILISVTILIIN